MKTNKRTIGKIHEEMAAEYLKKNGFKILDMNYRNRFGEIDIVAQEGKYLIFSEVKYRRSSSAGNPLYAVDRRKQKQISYTAMHYLRENKILDNIPIRFDVVSLMPNEIKLIRNAFDFSL